MVSCFITLRESGRQLNIGSLPAAELDSAPVRLFNTQTQAPMETYAKIYTIYITFQQSNFLELRYFPPLPLVFARIFFLRLELAHGQMENDSHGPCTIRGL